jgi:hypothetical protein
MIKKTRSAVLADKQSFLTPASPLLDNHFNEIMEASEEILGIVAILLPIPSEMSTKDAFMGRSRMLIIM